MGNVIQINRRNNLSDDEFTRQIIAANDRQLELLLVKVFNKLDRKKKLMIVAMAGVDFKLLHGFNHPVF